VRKNPVTTEANILEWLEEIKSVPARSPQAATLGRKRFLGQAVSASGLARHNGWNLIFRKERFAMNLIVSILVIAGLLVGGGATVGAAQNDLPGEQLYALKTWTENVSLQLQNGPQEEAIRLMEMAHVRIREMQQLTEAEKPVPDQVRQRLEQHVNQALQICSELSEAEVDGCLLQIQERLQNQFREMEQLMLHTPDEVQPVMEQTRTMLQLRLRLVEEGIQNHEMFRNAVRNGFRFGQEEEVVPPVQQGPGSQFGQPTDVPVGPNADPPGQGYGPGEPNAEPRGPNPDSGGSGNQVGPNPNDNGGPDQDNGGPNTGGNGTGGTNSGGNSTGGTSTGGSGSGSGGTSSGGNDNGGTSTGSGSTGGTSSGGGGTGGGGGNGSGG
jgi:hypothetical protein